MASTTIQGKRLIRMNVDVSATGAQDATSAVLNPSPFGPGRNMIVELDAAPTSTALYKLQTAPRYDPATGVKPATGSSLWVDLVSFTPTSPLEQEVTPAADAWHVRANVTALLASTTYGVNLLGSV